jgi:hypothetical protein
VSANAGTPSNFDISEGYIMLDYEVLSFAGATNITTAQPYFELEVAYDPAGSDVFFDNVTRDTYEIRRAAFNVNQPTGTHVRLLDENRLIAFMKLALLRPDIQWGQAYVDTTNKTLDLSKDINGITFADPKANYSKKYIFVKATGTQLIERILPSPDNLVAREYIIVPSTGTLRFATVNGGGLFVADALAGGFVEIKTNESIKLLSTKGVHGGGVLPFDYWRIVVGETATLTKVNTFRRALIQSKDTATWAGVAANAISLTFEGNTFDIDTSSQRTVDFISSLGIGARINIIATGQPFLINHDASGAPASYKPILLPEGTNLDCKSKDSTITLIETSTHWRVEGYDKKTAVATIPETSLTTVNMTLSSGLVKYTILGGGNVLISFNLSGSVGTGSPNFLSFIIPNVSVIDNTWSSCTFSGSNTGDVSLKLFAELNNRISMTLPDNSNFANNESFDIMGQIIINANIL